MARQYRVHAAAIVALVAVAGCAIVGPREIRNGRLAYNEAITTSNNQQLLMVAVHDRYEENANLLIVSSVTANVHVGATAGVEVGYGPDSNYAGNLVPFSAGMTYEENPTIAYVPVDGGSYVRQLMSPLPIAVLVQFSGASGDAAAVYRSLLSSVNDVANIDAGIAPESKFARFIALMTATSSEGCLHWVDQTAGRYAIGIDTDRCRGNDARDLLDLLGIAQTNANGPRVVLPVSVGQGRPDGTGVMLALRSVFELLQILSAAIDVPADDLASGAARPIAGGGGTGAALRVAYSKKSPAHAAVAVPYRGGWFYIDDGDAATKRFFRLISVLWSATLADTAQRSAPVLTLPASR